MNIRNTAILVVSLVFLSWLFSLSSIRAESVNLSVTIIDGSEPEDPPPSDGGSGGGSGGGSSGSGGGSSSSFSSLERSEVMIEGIAYPNRSVTLLKDGQVASQANAGTDGRFRFSLPSVSSGVYTFGIVSTDSTGNKSLTYTFTFRVAAGVNTSVTGVVLPPTVSVDKLEVKQGEPVNFIGYSYPDSNVFLSIHSLSEIVKRSKADKDGFWTFAFNTLEVEKGDHSVFASANGSQGESSGSDKVYFKVGDKTVLADKPKVIMGDSNSDNKVNLIDFSIMAYWYKRPLSTSAEKIVDLNGDKRVTLIDFSILAYYWTG